MRTVVLWSLPFRGLGPFRHGVTGRQGGVSLAPYESLNLAFHVGDDPDAVRANRQQVARWLGFSLEQMVCAEQVHGGRVIVVTDNDRGRGAWEQATVLPATDALVTDTPGLLLALFFADCLPVFFVDPERMVVAVAHAGWRGLVSGILENTVHTISECFGSAPRDLHAAIGPGIGQEHFEVGEEVAASFPDAVIARYSANGRPHVDLKRAARLRLEAIGIPDAAIAVSKECTFANRERYFSHRRDQGRTGRMGGFIGIYPPALNQVR